MDYSIAFVGGGNMAEAVMAGLIRNRIVTAGEILVTEKKAERRETLASLYSVQVVEANAEAPRRAKTLFLAVKPQILPEIQDEIKPYLTDAHLIISILAGQSRERLGKMLGCLDRIVRVMPNLPAQVGRAVSAITFPPALGQEERDWVRRILTAVGEVVEVDESLQDAVTAVSGSGPGYLFYLAEHWIAAAMRQGLPADVARTLVTETLAGAAQVLKERPDPPGVLAAKVATPGGTTEAGLSALVDYDLPKILDEVVDRATRRSKELNRG